MISSQNNIYTKIMVDETVEKAKKARKPYVWTPQRKEAFDRMKKKREEMLSQKKASIASGKTLVANEKSRLGELLKNTQKIKQILALIDSESIEDKPKQEVEKPAPVEIKVEKKVSKPKPVVKEKIPIPPPEPESEETEYEDSSDEEEQPPPPPKQKPPVNTFRYNTHTSRIGIPKDYTPPIVKKPEATPVKKVSPFLFL